MKGRNQSLDVLRAIAVFLVLLSHYGLNPQSDKSRNMPGLLPFGATGVDLFFVLSGFLISGLLFDEFKKSGRIDLKRFWMRRGFKIYPPLYVFLAVGTLSGCAWSELVFWQNYGHAYWIHTWSLAVEEHFYFALPLLLVLLAWLQPRKQNPFGVIPLISVLLSAGCLYLRIVAWKHGESYNQIVHPTHLRIDALFAGVTLGYFAHFNEASFREARAWWVLVVGLLGLMLSLPQLALTYFSYTFIVAWYAQRPATRGLWRRGLAWIGFYSYSIYLWHVVAMFVSQRLTATWFRLPLYLSVAVFGGVGMAKLVEVPALRIRERFFPSRALESSYSRTARRISAAISTS